MFYDTHCHLNDKAYRDDMAEVIVAAHESGVAEMNVVGCDWDTSSQAVEIAKKEEGIYAVVGVHPSDSGTYCDELEAALYAWAEEEKVVAIGEIGLDYHYDDTDKTVQEIVFRRQLKVAHDVGLPIVIHSRDAMADTLRILKEERQISDYRGVFHCYSGSYEDALKAIKMGFYIGVDGPLTYPNSRKLPEIVKKLPLERILIETDCPYLTPQQFRGKRNQPAYVRFVAEKIAELRQISVEEVAAATTENAHRLFHNK
ncbi:MAG: TatD family hydrolase [Bacillota bacterium]|nr:TatD family hydrolase [Bacillota bacterium]